MRDKYEKEVKGIVSRIVNKPANKFDINSDLFKDLNADSLRAIEIVAAVEKKYKIHLGMKKIAKIRNIAQIIDLIINVQKN